ncbi:hypothetical protein L6218_13315 [Pseudomonas syringae pv. syringae]|uniref:Uncharacterized protein n=7 Tax=Pseudomonas TaxID=286 RepID=A0ABU5B1U0_9PSED|nr:MULTISPECIES: hypothetical protein [Pseudomonas]MCW6054907.1 hypothetical protein [Pseudomonas fragi]MCF5314757.1 hypothetical protein [Pseudomonas syringae]MCF5361143.1 hypothetical protein [Pseudomonas syringae]MCF5388713.1 hypothetical protein [Pseudomonas syringae]MCF5401456.1 hypothetical protein [Pseudomonas syringae]
MHEQALLTENHPGLGSVGALVGINQIEELYKTSASANNAVKVKCANPSCGVKVSIVIPDKEKAGRKISPSAHFRGHHPEGCDRQPQPSSTTPTSASSQLNANPVKKDFPQVWIDPSSTAANPSGSSLASANQDQRTGSGVGGRSKAGLGASEGRSEMVKRFAKAWLDMTAQSRRMSSLRAPWNPEGTYDSAFYSFELNSTKFLGKVGTKIFTAPVISVDKVGGNFYLVLQEKTLGQAPKVVVLNSEVFEVGAAGRALLNQLNTFDPAQKIYLFVYGAFKYNSGASRSELVVKHPHFIYIDLPAL